MTDPDRQQEQPDSLVSPADIGSASRSCLAILVVIGAIFVLLVVFVIVQTVR